MDTAVVLTSGGINSTVAAAIAREQYEPALLHVNWGHRTAQRELAAFKQLAGVINVERAIVADLACLAGFGGNARASRRMTIEDATTLGSTTPTTFVPGLLPTLLSVAGSYAGAIGARRIIVGISEDHGVAGPAVSELYPDHRIEFLQAFNLMLSYARPPEKELIVEAPLIELTRAEVVQLGRRMGVPFEKTWSCYRDNDRPCGRCRPCVTRAAGFLQAKLPDPLLLEGAEASGRPATT